MKPGTKISNKRGPTWRTWGVVVGLLSAATGFGFMWAPQISLASQAMVYVLAVVIGAYTLSRVASVVCALGAVIAFNFFFVPPRWTFEVDSQQNLITLFAMLVVALVVSHLASDLRRKTALAHLHTARAQQLQSLAEALADAPSAPAVWELGQSALEGAFEGPHIGAWLAEDASLVFPVDVGEDAQDVVRDGMRSCMHEAAVLGPGTGRWPGLGAWYIPLGNLQHMHGAVCVQNVSAADAAGRAHAQALCALLAQALWRLKLLAAMQAAQALALRQQVQSTFLAAISHDLRTPLATVLGAATALQSQGEKLSSDAQRALQDSIVREARYLGTVTENTLQLVQLNNQARPLRRNWESMEEVVGAVLVRMREMDPSRRISTQVPQGLPLIEADAVLLVQLLGNLLDNALKYSSGPVFLVVNVSLAQMHLGVLDCGPTIAPSQREQLFEAYARGDHAGPHGSGLGLALCRAIATAHGGDLAWIERQGGGNQFRLSLPLRPAPLLPEEE